MELVFGISVNTVMYILSFVIGRTVYSNVNLVIAILVLIVIIGLSIIVNIRLVSRYHKKFKKMAMQGFGSLVLSFILYFLMRQVLVVKLIDPIYLIAILPIHLIATVLKIYVIKERLSNRESFWGKVQ